MPHPRRGRASDAGRDSPHYGRFPNLEIVWPNLAGENRRGRGAASLQSQTRFDPAPGRGARARTAVRDNEVFDRDEMQRHQSPAVH